MRLVLTVYITIKGNVCDNMRHLTDSQTGPIIYLQPLSNVFFFFFWSRQAYGRGMQNGFIRSAGLSNFSDIPLVPGLVRSHVGKAVEIVDKSRFYPLHPKLEI